MLGEGISTNSSIDRDSFQTFLANSFAVQESGLDSRSLSALMEIQRLVGTTKFDLDRAIQMIAEHALQVSSASGAALALLENGELVYRAGSGCAAQDVGRHVPAVLSVNSAHQVRREILRVENAGSDTRIEAAICRQFGAMSLLMLPIYRDEAVAGVLQVVSGEPHRFDECEVRTYRLMIAALESGISRHATAEANKGSTALEQLSDDCVASTGDLESIKNAAEAIVMVAETARQDALEGQLKTSNSDGFEQPGTRAWLTYRAMLVPHRSALWVALRDALRKGRTALWSVDLRYSGAAIGMVVALSLAVWISHRHSSTSKLGITVPETHDAYPAETVQASPGQLGTEKVEPPVLKGFRRVWVGPNEVDEIAEDVTIRYFGVSTAKPKSRQKMKELKFGKDVTVRYFPDGPVTVAEPAAIFESGHPQQTKLQSR